LAGLALTREHCKEPCYGDKGYAKLCASGLISCRARFAASASIGIVAIGKFAARLPGNDMWSRAL